MCFIYPKKKSGKRDSDPRPQPWQGCALPTELFPQNVKKTNGEEEETRTPTSQLTLPPQSSASTNSATSPSNKHSEKCPEQDSNLHASRHTHLKRARLPIPPPGHFSLSGSPKTPAKKNVSEYGAENGTRTRDPNLGKVVLYQLSYFRVFPSKVTGIHQLNSKLSEVHFSKCECKGNDIFGTDKLLSCFFSKNLHFLSNPFYFYSLRNRTHKGFQTHRHS